MKTEVCITVDVEFDIAGTFADPDRKRPVATDSVRCRVQGRDYGIGFILDTLERYGLRGVFFVEAVNTCYFGLAPMGDIAREIAERGHDVQLHLHPVWSVFRTDGWKREARQGGIHASTHDSFSAASLDRSVELMELGIATFAEWGLPKPIALRVGNLDAERDAYRAMARVGIPLASNLGFGLSRPRDETLHRYSGHHWIEGILEIPVTSFRVLKLGPYQRWQILTILGVSSAEMNTVLFAAKRRRQSPVVILTHASEFFFRVDGPRPNRLTQRRFRDLCRFLCENDSDFEVTTFREGRDAWTQGGDSENPIFSVPTRLTAQRLIADRLARKFKSGGSSDSETFSGDELGVSDF